MGNVWSGKVLNPAELDRAEITTNISTIHQVFLSISSPLYNYTHPWCRQIARLCSAEIYQKIQILWAGPRP